MEKYISYFRVSTDKQGEDGNGMKAQRQAVQKFLQDQDASQIDCFTEVESGTNGDRPILKSAIDACKQQGAKLLVAKLDRLSRNVKFLFTLKEELEAAGVGFTIADMPQANNTMVLGVVASMAQHEAEIISERTKEGIRQSEVYKAGNWGNPENLTKDARQKAWETISRKARTDTDTRKAFHFIQPRRKEGMSYAKIAKALNKEGYRTRTGKRFHPSQVRKIWLRFNKN